MLGSSGKAGFRLVLGWVALLLVLTRDAGAADVAAGVVRFALCRANIQSSSLFKAGERWGFVVTIDRQAGRDLALAARQYRNHTLELSMGDTLLHRGPIAVAVRSRSFTSLSPDLASAKRDLELFRGNLYEGPCGLIAEAGA